jgi:myo-inositol-1(or 4)-monophosphatase
MRSPLVQTMIDASRAGARVLLESFSRLPSLAVRDKGTADFVSQADLRSEAVIKEALIAFDPHAKFQAEESEADRVALGPRFIIDPLDGTTNFLHGIPHFAVTIAYADDTGVVAGVVLDPSRDELFWADRGAGAFILRDARERPATFLGEQRLAASTRTSLEDSVIHTGVPHRGRGDHDLYLAQLRRVMAQVAGVRRLGAAALDLAYVAAGRGDGFFECGLAPWDVAAGLLLVREAGGRVTDLEGGDAVEERREVVAAAAQVHAPLLEALRVRPSA